MKDDADIATQASNLFRDTGLAAESDAPYRNLLASTETGFCIIEMKFDADDRAVDYLIVEGNAAFEAMTGLEDPVGHWVSEIAPGLEQHWFDTYGRVALTGEAVRFENPADIFGRWYVVQASRIGAARDDGSQSCSTTFRPANGWRIGRPRCWS